MIFFLTVGWVFDIEFNMLEKCIANVALSSPQVIEELNLKNSLLSSEKEELNTLIIEQAQQLTGTWTFVLNISS